MNRKVCISCNNIINSEEDFEEYLDDSVNKILRNRKYSGLWIHNSCSPSINKYNCIKKKEKENDNVCDNNENENYYKKLKVIVIGKKKYLFDSYNTIAYYYRASHQTFKKQKTSRNILNYIMQKEILVRLNNTEYSEIKKCILNINNYIDKEIIIIDNSFKEKIRNILFKLHSETKFLEVDNLFYKILGYKIDDIEEHKKMLYKSPLSYIEKIKNTHIYHDLKLHFFEKHDKISPSGYWHQMYSEYKYMVKSFLYTKYPLKNMENNIVFTYNNEDKKKVNKYFLTMIIISECNCHYSNKTHFINERVIISLVKPDHSNYYKLDFKPLSDHQIDLITSNNLCCTQEIIDKDDKCPLCYKDYEINEKLIKLKCNHIFCNDKECLKEWLKIKKICPYCNFNL